MKKLVACLSFILTCTSAYATHIAGGDLTYKFVGSSSSPFRYEITLTLYRINSPSVATLGGSAQVQINSSCTGLRTVTLTRVTPPGAILANDGGYILEPDIECADTNSPSYLPLTVHQYKTTVNLYNVCQDFVFTYSTCCRNGQISNLTTPASQSFHITALLNSFSGSNNSPSFKHIPITNVCLSKPAYNHFGCTDVDGDSLFYELETPRTTNNAAITYAAGYSETSPIKTVNGVFLDSLTGLLSFLPAQVETDVVRVKVREYRFNPNNSSWTLIGSVTRDIEVAINPSCLLLSSDSAFFSTNANNIDTASTIACNDSIIVLKLQKPVLADSITNNASEFSILDGRGLPIPIISAIPHSTLFDGILTDEILLKTSTPFIYNDTLSLQLKKGNDGNTLVGACGGKATEANITLVVKSCTTFFDLDEKQELLPFSVYPNPARDFLTVKFTEAITREASINIYNAAGMLVKKDGYELTGTSELKVNCESLPAGVYQLQVVLADKKSYTVSFTRN